jgi:fibronectin-binding autotransporter adhesin
MTTMSKSTHQRKSRTNVCARSIPASGKALPLRRTWPISLCVGLAVGSIVFSGDALAGGPTGGVVVGGTGSITQSGNSTIINQASQKLALNWQTFNVGANESVLFNQPGRSAVALNRILDQNPSQIFGRISSNGQIFLINTHGIIFGATAQMNVGGLLASTLDLTPNDFLAGHYNLNATGVGAGIVNHGLIQAASGGSVALVGGSVLNDGLIFANYGKINLDGADHAVLDFDGNGLINIQITGELKQRLDQREAAVTNKGTLRAEDGTVVLQASATKDLFTGLVNNTGVIDASGISTDGGVVRLIGNGGNVESSGSINVSGVHGGSAQLLSDRNVGVTGGIDASGTLGGGNIRVGGGWQGGEGLQTAAVTYLGPDATLNADAIRSGDGGSVVTWGNQGNNFYGRISARGGAYGGNGGRVETSSHYGLNAQGSVDASAAYGLAGIWLLDPYDVTIGASASGTAWSNPYTPTATSTIKATDISGALKNNTDVFVFTNNALPGNGTDTGNITVNSNISATGAGNLYLEAAGGIFLNADISGKSTSNPLDLHLWANYGGAAAGTAYSSRAACPTCVVTIGNTASAAITTFGGVVDIRTGDVSHAGGAVNIGNGTFTGSIDTSGTAPARGALTIDAVGITQLSAAGNSIKAGAATLNAGSGAIALNNTGNDFTGTVSLIGSNVSLVNSTATILGTTTATGTLDVSSNGALTQSGALTVTGAATFTQNSTTAGATQDISLGSQNNSLQGAVTFAAGAAPGAGVNNLSLKNTFATPGTLTLPANVAGILTLNYTNAALAVPLAGVVAGGLDLTAGGGITINGNVSTSGAQAYHSAVMLGADAILASTGSGNIGFDSTVDGAYALTVNTSGTTGFGGMVGATTMLTSLTTNAGGSTILGGDVTTSGAQTYSDGVTLGGNVALATAGSNVSFNSTVDNASTTARNLTVNAGTGTVTFGGAVGGDVANGALGALSVNSTGTTSFNGTVRSASLATNAGGGTTLGDGNVTTSGTQTYGDTVTLGANAILAGTTVGLAAVTGTGNNLTVTGNAMLAGPVSGVNVLQVTGTTNLNTASVSTSGGQTYSGAVTLGAGTTLASSGSGAIGFGSTVNGAHGLTVNTGGTTSFAGAVGGTTALTSLSTDAGGSTMLGSNVTTSGAQAYNDAVALGADLTLATANGAVSFGSTVDNATATKRALTVNAGTGAVTFTGALGANGALTSLVTHSGTFNANALNIGSGGLAVTTTVGGIAQGGAFTVAGASSFNAGSGAITLTDAGNDFVGAVSLSNSGANDVSVSDANALVLGASTLGSGALTLTATGISQTGAIVQAAGGGTVTLDAGAGDLTLTDAGNDFTGSVTASGQAVRITDATALDMVGFTSAPNKDVSLVAGGQLTLAPTITAIDTGSGNLTLSSGTSLTTQGNLSGNNVSLSGASGLTLNNDITATGTLTLASSTGGISQPGGIILVGGTSSLSGGTGAVSLTSVGNDFGGAVTASGSSIALTDMNALTTALTTGGNAVLTAVGNLAVSGSSNNLTTNAGATSFGATTVSGNLSTTATGAISQTGALSVTGSSSLAAGANAITLANAGNNFTGAVGLSNSGANNVSIRDANGLILGNVNVGTGTLGVQAVGITQAAGTAIVQSAAAGAASFNSGGGVLTLANTGNDFTGTVSLTGGSTQITDANALTLGTLATGALSAVSTGALNLGTGNIGSNLTATSNNGAISQTGALAVTGSSTINAGTGAITLTDAGNDFVGAVSLSNSGANDVSVSDANALVLGASTLGSGALTLTATGISQTGAIVQAAGGGTVTLDAGAGDLTLTDAGNDFTGSVTASGQAVRITDATALDMVGFTSAPNKDVSLVAGGQLTLAPTITAIDTGSGNLTLSSGTSLTTQGNLSGNNVSLSGASGLTLNNDITATGTLTLASSTGGISQPGGIILVGGTSSLSGGTGAVSLTSVGNDFGGAVTASGSSIALTDMNALTTALTTGGNAVLTAVGNLAVSGSSNNLTTNAGATSFGATTVSGNLSTTATGAISQTGALSVTGSSSLAAGANAITLANAGNNFTGAVGLSNSGANNVSIRDANGLILGNVNVGTGTLGVQAVGITQAAGTAIVQSAAAGAASFNSGGGVLTLANTGNDFTGTVSLTGGSTQITDANALTLGTLATGALSAVSTGALNLGTGNIGSNLTATSNNGAISQTGALAVTGSSTINAGSGTIALTNTGNDFTGAVNLTGGSTQITDTNALTLGTLSTGALTAASTGALNLGSGTVGGNLAAASNNNAISQTGALAVTGSSTLNAGSGAIALTNTGNDFTGAVSLTGGTTQITDANALTLGTLSTGALTAVSTGALNLGNGTVGGTLAATSNNNAISQTGALAVTGSSTLNAGSGAIALTNTNNDFGGAVTATGTGVQITDANDLAIAGLVSGANGAVNLIAGGVLTLPVGAIDTGTADLALVSNGGSLTTSGALSGANVSLTGHGGVTLNSNVTAAGTLSLVSGAAISQGAGIITAGTLTGSSIGNTTLNRANKIGTLGSFSAANFSLINAQALTVSGPLTTASNAGDIDLETTGGALVVNADLAGDTVALTSAGNLALSKNLQGSTVALVSGGSISQGGGVITAGTLSGSAVGSTTLNQANKVAALGAFSSTGLSFTNGQTLTVNGPLNGGASVALTTTAGNLAVNGAVSGTTTTLKSAGAISEGASGSITAATLTGQSGGATALNGANHIGALGSFNAANFALTNAQALTVSGPVSGGASTALTTTTGDLAINGTLSGTTTTLKSAGAISEGAGGNIVAGTLAGQSSGATALNGANHVGALGNFSAANFALTNAQALTVSGPVNGGASTTLTTTTGDLAINGAISGTTTTLHSAAAITEGAGGSITANLLTGHSIGNATLDGNNHINTLGSFTSDFSLTNAQTLTVVGPLDGGPSVALTTTAGDLIINGAISGTTTTLKSAGTISQGAGGSITASTLTGQSAGATTLNGANHIGTLGSFTAAGFALANAQALTVGGPVAGGSSTTLATTAGNLTINGAVSGTQTTLNSAGAISEGSSGSITAATLSGSAAGGTMLGSATDRIGNMVDTLGNFSSPAGFSMTNNKTLTLASVAGSAFTVNAGTSAFYLSVTNGDLFQLGTTPVYNGMGVWGSTGRMGTGVAPIYVIGTGLQTVANIGMPPAYFYAVDSGGNLLPLGGGLAVNVPTASGAGSAQNGNHGDSYVDPSVITANYRSYGIVPSGVRLPADQQAGCDPDQPDQLDCEGGDTVGMVRMMMNVRR